MLRLRSAKISSTSKNNASGSTSSAEGKSRSIATWMRAATRLALAAALVLVLVVVVLLMTPSPPRILNREVCDAEIKRIVKPILLGDDSFSGTNDGGVDAILDLTIQATIQATENSTSKIVVAPTTATKSGTTLFVLAAALVQQAALDTNECGDGVGTRDLNVAKRLEDNLSNWQRYDELFSRHYLMEQRPLPIRSYLFLPNSIGVLIVDQRQTNLEVLYALYPNLPIGGFLIMTSPRGHVSVLEETMDKQQRDAAWGSSFFPPKTATIQTFSDGEGQIQWLQKTTTQIGVPPEVNDNVQLSPLITQAWDQLNTWQQEASKETAFTGNIRDNKFQSKRYGDVLQRLILTGHGYGDQPVLDRVNVCETGFNGGHSAMMFLAFNNFFEGTFSLPVYYYGWDAGQFAAARPMAQKLKEQFNERFTITWGNTKEVMHDKEVMKEALGEGDTRVRCDLIVIDGEHSLVGIQNDLGALLPYATPGSIVFIDDFNANVPMVSRATAPFVQDGKIVPLAHYQTPYLGSKGFIEAMVPIPSASNAI